MAIALENQAELEALALFRLTILDAMPVWEVRLLIPMSPRQFQEVLRVFGRVTAENSRTYRQDVLRHFERLIAKGVSQTEREEIIAEARGRQQRTAAYIERKRQRQIALRERQREREEREEAREARRIAAKGIVSFHAAVSVHTRRKRGDYAKYRVRFARGAAAD